MAKEEKKKEYGLTDLPGVGAATAEKLQEAGLDSLMSIAVVSPGEIVELTGLSEANARKIINFARNKLDMGFESGEDLLKKREQLVKITTGSKSFDALIGGGIEAGAITECFGAYGCLTGDANITLGNGSVRSINALVGNYKPGIYDFKLPILTKIGSRLTPTLTSKLFVYNCDEIVNIKLNDGRDLSVTKNHPLMTRFGWKKAEDLNKDDQIAVEYDNIFPKNYLKLNLNIKLSKFACNVKEVSLPVFLTPKLGKFLGYQLGEGWTEKASNAENGGIVRTSFRNGNDKIMGDWREISTELFEVETKLDKREVPTGKIESVWVGEFLKQFDGLIYHASNKFVPEQIFSSPKEVVIPFLVALYDGEGHVKIDMTERTREHIRYYGEKRASYTYTLPNYSRDIELRSASIKLIKGVQLLLSKLNMESWISRDETKKDGKVFVAYKLHISNKDNIEKFYALIGKDTLRLKEKIEKALDSYKRTLTRKAADLLPIKAITYNALDKGKVYDFEVPGTHNFLANGILSHNSGKTSLAHQLAVNVQLPKDKGGAEGIAVWIDSESTLRPEYLKKLAEAKGLNSEEALRNFRGVRSFNSDHQMLLAEKVEDLIKEGLPVKLVIVDSLMGHFRSDFSGRGQLADRQQKLNKHMHALMKLATKYNLAVYITNQVMSRPDVFFGDPTEAIGGHVLAHACLTADTLIQLTDGSILPISKLNGPASLPAIDFNDMKSKTAFCDWGSKRNDVKEIYEIDIGSKIKASGEHRFFKINNFEVEELEAKNLKEGDYLMHVNKIEVEGELQKLPIIEHKELIKINKEGSKLIKNELKKINLTRKEICKNLTTTPRQLRRVLNQEYPTDSQIPLQLIQQGISEELYNYIEPCETKKYRHVTLPVMLDYKFAQVLGYYIGDGNSGERSLRFKDERIDVLECYAGLCKELFNLDGRISIVRDKNCYQFEINSTAVNELLKEIEDDTLLLISKSTKDVVRAFIRGFMDAEGYVSKDRARISLSQKDKQTLDYLQMLLLRFGIRSNRKINKQKSGEFCDILLFDGRDFNDFAKNIGVTAKDKKKSMLKWMEHCDKTYRKEIIPIPRKELWNLIKEIGVYPSTIMRPRSDEYKFISKDNLQKAFEVLIKKDIPEKYLEKVAFIEKVLSGEVRFERVRKIRKLENSESLYDISVPVLENYIANGFVVHNSTYRLYLRRGKKGTRVAKLVDAPAIPDGECAFMITEEGIKDV